MLSPIKELNKKPDMNLQPKTLSLAIISVFWFANNFMWSSILAIILPSQIEKYFGEENKARNLTVVVGCGALVALVIHPLFGAISDYSNSKLGRRKSWLLFSILPKIILLLFMPFAADFGLWVLALIFVLIQLLDNVSEGPWSAIINDLVPPPYLGRASGWKGIWMIAGIITSALITGAILNKNDDLPAYRKELVILYGTIVFVQLICVLTSLIVVKETPYTGAERFHFIEFLKGFDIKNPNRRNFWWVFVTRFLFSMGTWTIFNFLQYYAQDVLKVASGEKEVGSYLLPAIMLSAFCTVYLTGHLSDKYGRKRLIYLSGAILTFVCFAYIFNRDIWVARLLAFIFGIGYGIYLSVDWALICDVLPDVKHYGRDMGIWSITLIAPQILGIVLGGIILTLLNNHGVLPYSLLMGITGIYFLLSSMMIRKVKNIS